MKIKTNPHTNSHLVKALSLLSGKSKREAFKIAQLKLKSTYSEPYYWGAFVMVGE